MTIHNRIGVTSYQRTMTKRLAGSPAAFELPLTRAMRNPLRQQVTNIAIGTFDTDTDSITITVTEPDGTVHTQTVTRAAGVPADASAAATAFADAFNADPATAGVFTADDSTTNVVLTFDHAGIDYDVVATASAGTTATVSETTDPAGVAVPIGRFVVLAADAAIDGQRAIALPGDTSTAEQIVGVVMRPLGQFVNGESPLQSAVDSVPAGRMCDVAFNGMVNVLNAGDADASEKGAVWVAVDADADIDLGAARGDADGVLQVATLTPGAGQNSVEVSVEITITGGDYVGQTKLLSVLTDASMTATEWCDAARVQLNADPLWSTLLVDSGTATLILTAASPDITFDVNNVQGTVTIDNATTAGDPYTVKVPGAYWAEDTPAGQVGPVMLRM